MADVGKAVRQNTVQTKNLIYNKSEGIGPSFGPCIFDERHGVLNMAGNVFLLGLVVLINEILDLVAAQSLEFILEPCVGNNAAEEIVAADVAANEAAIDISGIIGL